ncbi:MAG: hypothetical protein H6721_34150 [Sandaracinus sp.]|nr:hypothetical protein [Sandaracinus sp.]
MGFALQVSPMDTFIDDSQYEPIRQGELAARRDGGRVAGFCVGELELDDSPTQVDAGGLGGPTLGSHAERSVQSDQEGASALGRGLHAGPQSVPVTRRVIG